MKYGPPGQVVTVGTSGDGDRLWIRVEDEGPGIPVHERERVWERFSRLDRDGGSAAAGTGIGLAVASDLVRLHGGRAWVDDAPTGGARFVVELPKGPAGPPRGESGTGDETASAGVGGAARLGGEAAP
jgi:signal transduction histidine kinase